MEFFRFQRDIPFMRHALVFNVISLVTFLAAVGLLAFHGLNFGVDFRGGTVIEVGYAHAVDFTRLAHRRRQALRSASSRCRASAARKRR